MKANKITLEQALLHELFDYNGEQLVWKSKVSNLSRVKLGEVAGHLINTGYRSICIAMQRYVAHRLIWVYHNGSIDTECEIDHINGDRSDNRIENLRAVTHQGNQWNRLNTKGYGWHAATKKWQSYITVNDKRMHLGLFNKEEDARQAYLNAKEQYHIIKEAA